MYSSALTTSSQKYGRSECQPSNYYYEAIEVKVIDTGYYGLSSKSTIDIYNYIYKNTFIPFKPTENLLSVDTGSCANGRLKLTTVLQANTTYILVVTTYSPNVMGAFSIIVFGPNNVSLNRISEYLYFLY